MTGELRGQIDRQCKGKIGHVAEDEARRAAKLMHKRYKAKFSAYSCPWCKMWHVGTQRSQRQAAERNGA